MVKAFLSMPYGRTNHEQVYWRAFEQSIRAVAAKLPSPRLEIVCARDHQPEDLRLKDNVKSLISKCQFTIAVVTGRNPNVYWEIGYTECAGKNVVYLIDEDSDDVRDSPVLAAEVLKCGYHGNTLARDTGAFPEHLKSQLTQFLTLAIRQEYASTEAITYLSREDCDLANYVGGARRYVRLLTTNLDYFASEDKFFVENDKGEQIHAFDIPIKKNIEVQILTLDPESSIVNYRAKQLSFQADVGLYREELKRAARRLYQKYQKHQNFTLKVYDDLPLQWSLLVDDNVITAAVGRSQRSRSNPHFLLSNRNRASGSYKNHFKEVAVHATDIKHYSWATSGNSVVPRKPQQ